SLSPSCVTLIPRALISARTFIVPKFSRAHHSATARFTTTSPEGTPVTRDIEVWLGEPAQAYVMFDPEISKTFQTSGRCSRRLLPNTRPGVTCPELPPRYPALFSRVLTLPSTRDTAGSSEAVGCQ
ncbi:hypothetical protein BKA61DRAFT_616283, partial [Leptodontidium sp. MPI-SDFR-AT-0119]